MITDQREVTSAAWQKLVSELAAVSPDDRGFLEKLLRIVGQVSAARQAVVYVPMSGERGEMIVRPLALWPSGAGAATGGSPAVILPEETGRAAYAAIESGNSRVFALSGESAAFDNAPGTPGVIGQIGGHVIALALPGEQGEKGSQGTDGAQPPPTGQTLAASPGAITLVLEPRSRQALQSTLAMAELIIGYIHLHAVRGSLRRAVGSFAAMDSATRLLASINAAETFKAAAIQLVNDLSRQFSAERAALGWVEGDSCRVIALSDTEHFDRRTAMIRKVEAAMDECLDQEQPVLYPAPAMTEDAVLGQAIVHCHRELGAGDDRLRVCSIPLRRNGEVVGVITLEARTKTDHGIDTGVVDRLQAAMDLVTPTLAVRKRDDLPLYRRAVESARHVGAWAVGPRHTIWKLATLSVIAAFILCAFVKITHRVGATAELRPTDKRVVAVPFDGVIRSITASAEAGQVVTAGDVLLELDTAELRLQLQDARARLVQAEKAQSQGMKENKPAEAARAAAQADAARAQAELYQSRLDRARVLAPIGGTVIAGNVKDKVGASVKIGEELFQIAPLGSMQAVVKLDESDLLLDGDGTARIRPGTRGEIATRSNPGAGFPVTVLRVVPLAVAGEGKNMFEVWVSVDQPASWMRPGMEGVVRLDSGSRSLLWIGTRRVVDTIRLWLW